MEWLVLFFLQFCRLSLFVKASSQGTNCTVKTTSGECCVFPFTYGGKPRWSCITTGSSVANTQWCATSDSYDADATKWGDCDMAEHPYRWVPTHGRATSQSSTVAGHEAYFATDGNYNRYYTPLTYSQTGVSDDPYLQVDMGEKKPVDVIVFHFPMLTTPAKTYEAIRVTLSDTPTFAGSHLCFGTYNANSGRRDECNAWGRYLTIQSKWTGVELSVIEIAAHRRPVESIAFNKPATASSGYGSESLTNVVDMNYRTHFFTNQEVQAWMRVDLEELYYIREVMIWTRHDCCQTSKANIAVRAGRSLVNNGNSNHFCGNHVFYTFEIYSFYCKVIARYVTIQRLEQEALIFANAEIVVNPETTDNVAVHSSNSGNIPVVDGNVVRHLTDGLRETCHVMTESAQNKNLYITMGATYDVYKIFIVNNPTKLDALVDFVIKIGMEDSSKPLCVAGQVYQNMAGISTKAFYCLPRRSGNEIYIYQVSSEKTMSICEVAVYTEAEPAVNRNKDHYVWAEENTNQLLLTCEANGYPVPVLSWVRKNETLESASSTLELNSLVANHSGEYECWANNTHGADVKVVDLVVTSNLRMCVNFKEIQFKVGKSESEEFYFRGNEWYSFYDPDNQHSLQFREDSPQVTSRCHLWLNGNHPMVKDGVVSRQLCLESVCSTKYDVHVRRCGGSYVYNFRDLKKISSFMTFCLRNAKNLHTGMNPMVASPKYGHALSGNVFRTETDVEESHHCLLMCQISPNCKSFNFSRKEKVCELNSATKKDFPKSYRARSGYDHYQFGKGMVVTRRGDL